MKDYFESESFGGMNRKHLDLKDLLGETAIITVIGQKVRPMH